MAWTTPGTAVAGTVLTAAFWNTQVRDNTTDLRSYQNRYDKKTRASTDLTLTSTTPANVDTALDITLGATAGDVLEIVCCGLWSNSAFEKYLDVATLVSGSVVNYISGTTFTSSGQGVIPWKGLSSVFTNISGSFFYTTVSGDISGGNVVLRLRYKVGGSSTLYAVADYPFVWFARNLGPVTT